MAESEMPSLFRYAPKIALPTPVSNAAPSREPASFERSGFRTEDENSMSGFSTTLIVNSLFWITSLRPTERGVTRRIQEDLLPYLDSIGVQHQTFEPQTTEKLLAILSDIGQQTTGGLRPILHFDTHGDLLQGI